MIVPLAIIFIVLMMVLPIPRVLVDGFLAISLAVSIGVFLIGLFMEGPLEFSSFPAVILIATLLRLSLNVATTRLILLKGHEGHGAAGHVVETFGRFVVEGNVVVGLVVFLILVVINFVVITKGAGRVAEVAARFALDGMPGKQMAIDADLNAGIIGAEIARERRRNVEREADFFGAMDGASKFVKGDAVAGLLITAINLVGGLMIGLSRGMTLSSAAETFSILSVGDALVSQIPALLISTAAGVVVTRSATGDQIARAFQAQLLGSRRAVTATAGVLTLFALLPGMPAIPFLAIAGGLFWLGRQPPPGATTEAAAKPEAAAQAAAAPRPGSPEDIDGALPLDVLALEVGYELVQVVDPELGGTLVDRIGALRKQIAIDLGTVIPPVHIRDNLELLPGVYRILLLGTEVARGTTRAGRLLAMDPTGSAGPLDGEAVKDPAFGTPARWIHPRDRELAEALGATVVDHTTIVATHLGEVARTQAHKILGRAELAHLFEVFSKSTPKLIEDLVPNLLSTTDVLKVLRNLLRENVSIRDLRTVLEGLIELAPATRDTEQLTELCRQRLSRQISAQYTGSDDVLAGLVLDAPVEDMFRRSLREIASGTGGALNPEHARILAVSLEAAVARMVKAGRPPCIIASPDVRRYVRAFAERRVPQLAVISFREIEPDIQLRPFETISFTTSEAA
ncbi:MAG TPA: flagellar biosynthesis protein FlhA [Polyangiaceae bacterium]|jgi:flagellar biosynthesis protein FlhA|nr:flagellar biosynthesis protein FlhA [Polyangiaceae bacterium]